VSQQSYWEGRKHPFLTDENARRKWEQIFPDEDFSLLEEFHPRKKLQMLRWVDYRNGAGKLEVLHSIMEMNCLDYRDTGIAEMFHAFFLPFDATQEEEKAAVEQDGREYLEWLSS